MAVAFRSAAFGPTKPAGVVAGDLLLATVHSDNPDTVLSMDGFTLIRSSTVALGASGTGFGLRMATFYRVATASEPASYPATSTLSGSWSVVIVAYSGAHATSPIQASVHHQGSSGSEASAPGVTTLATNTLVAAVASRSINVGMGTPTGTTSRILRDASLDNSEIRHVDYVSPTVGLSRSVSFPSSSSTNTGYAYAVHQIAVREANRTPNAPTLTTMASGDIVAAQDVNRAAHSHSDPDGDGQAAFRIRYRLVGATAWTQPADQVTVNQFYDFPVASLAVGNYERQVQTFDGKLWGPWSASGFFTVATRPPGVTFVSPINGSTSGEARVNAEISYAEGTAEYRLLDSFGAELLGWVGISGKTFTTPPLANSQTVTLQARNIVNTLAGPTTSVNVLISYTPPAQPPGSVAVGPYALLVTSANPAPEGGQPQVAYNELERASVVAGAPVPSGDPRRGFLRDPAKPGRQRLQLRTRSTYADPVESGVDFAYRFHAVAVNGARSPGPWIFGSVDLGAGNEGLFADAVFDPAVFE